MKANEALVRSMNSIILKHKEKMNDINSCIYTACNEGLFTIEYEVSDETDIEDLALIYEYFGYGVKTDADILSICWQ